MSNTLIIVVLMPAFFLALLLIEIGCWLGMKLRVDETARAPA